ncbi:hypothetical protein HYPSUDRAFT_60589 [Hypholoma sublateritium FD-334 SS-4]|uniref:Uncharacterized protein n=1 Tax=Hypholoma sublateritium (strain FD-334 SS-4) TaxID=945553 RepID=A0A0D2PG42_HYPSF|nr:hypothetical protein HYPSUDRAFT_60589 [Hypholoma sublateritium FD-334 SS-4]
MGKWTANYTDDVLHAKLSNLVSGSIRRSAVEKETSISYENFVTDLETGDSFTASLVDILVKELADRRTRNSDNDRKLIGEHTIRSLRMLANSSRSFSQRIGHTHPRRGANRAEYFTSPMDLDEEDDEYEIMMDDPSIIEGARMNADLYDAYTPNVWPPSSSTRRITGSPSAAEDWAQLTLGTPDSETGAPRPWNPVSTITSSGLSRQASIRRQRSRVDFHEYAHRRRSNVRESVVGSRSDAPESVTEPREGLSTGSGTVRRFFPFHRPRRTNPPWTTLSDTLSQDSEEAGPMRFGSAPYFPDPTHGPWYQHTGADTLRTASPDADNRDDAESLPRAPRLRLAMTMRPAAQNTRSRYASPVAGNLIPIGPLPATSDPVESADTPAVPPSSPRPDQDAYIPSDEAVAYPTPGSTESENTA